MIAPLMTAKKMSAKKGGQQGNRNASQTDNNLDAQITLRVMSAEKSAWVKAAHPGKLTDWVRKVCNAAALRGRGEARGDQG